MEIKTLVVDHLPLHPSLACAADDRPLPAPTPLGAIDLRRHAHIAARVVLRRLTVRVHEHQRELELARSRRIARRHSEDATARLGNHARYDTVRLVQGESVGQRGRDGEGVHQVGNGWSEGDWRVDGVEGLDVVVKIRWS